ncbi:MAG: F0F1 ATP synthase subunit epsilon [Bryobacterales bacterium]|nr:F0F1 ATP synthase subunit epsilon [Bryobacterales bacterium]
MAADTFELEIATPERLLVKDRASEAEIPCTSGQIGVLPGHAPLLSELGIGELVYVTDGKKHSIAVSGGVVEVQPELVRILAMTAEKPEDVDTNRAQSALKRAHDRLDTVKDNVDYARALNSAQRAQARINVAASRKI